MVNIPMPKGFGESLLQGADVGTSIFQRLIQPYMEATRLAQQAQLSKAGMGQRAEELALQREKFEEEKRRSSPEYFIDQMKKIQELSMPQGSETAPMGVAVPQVNLPAYTPESSEFGMFSDLLSPPQLQSEQVLQPTQSYDITKSAETNPMMRAFLKQKFGIDFGKPAAPYQGPAREAADLERLRQAYGEDSPVYKMAIARNKADLARREGLVEKTGLDVSGIKRGERPVYDEEGQLAGVDRPLSAKEREEVAGRNFFNTIYPQIYKGLAPFSGQGSITRIMDAANNYGVDPESTRLIDDYLLGQQLLTAGTVKEASTLASGKQKATYDQIRKSLESSDIPKKIDSFIKQFGLPASAKERAAERFQQILSDAQTQAEESIPAFRRYQFQPSGSKSSEDVDLSKMSDAELERIARGGK